MLEAFIKDMDSLTGRYWWCVLLFSGAYPGILFCTLVSQGAKTVRNALYLLATVLWLVLLLLMRFVRCGPSMLSLSLCALPRGNLHVF